MTDRVTAGPAGREVDAITPVAQDYLKVIWSATEWGGAPITSKALADRFGTTQANVSETMKRLAAQELVDYRPYRPVALTERGTALALAMVRRHRLVECFLVSTLGYDADEVHAEAERLEHAVSDTMIDRIDALLGRPSADPHGDPIPRPDGAVVRPSDTVRLSEAGPGRYRVVRVSDAEPGPLGRLLERGIEVGVTIDVGSGGAVRSVTGAGGRDIDPEDCALIRVRPSR